MLFPLRRKAVRSAKSLHFRPQVTALEDRRVPATLADFPLPPINFSGYYPSAITEGPDGNLWFTDPAARAVGRITPAGQVTEFTPPSPDAGPSLGAGNAITTGADGNIWFATEMLTGAITRVTPDGQFATFRLGNNLATVNSLTSGPDGNVWFTENVYPFVVEKVGFITPTGQITEYTLNAPSGVRGNIGGITVGPDGNLWFTHDGTLATITPSGTIRDHLADNVVGSALTTGPDGNLWTSGPRIDPLTGSAQDFVQRISLTGNVTTFNVGTTSYDQGSIVAGPDGNLWFTEPDSNQIGQITPTGQITLFTAPTAGGKPTGIVAGPNGNIWFTESGTRHIGEVFLTGTPPAPAANTSTALAIDVRSPAVGQTVHLTATVTSTAGIPTGGTVTFFDGSSAIGTASLDASGHATLTTLFRTASDHSLTAVFNGTADFALSRSSALTVTVNRASTTTTLNASANPARTGKKLALTVNVLAAFTGAGVPTGTIILRDGNTTLGTATLDSTGQAVFTFTPGQTIRNGKTRITILPKGTHHLTVSYSSDSNFAASDSVPLVLTVV